MSSPRIASKNHINNEHDKSVFVLSDLLYDTAMKFTFSYLKEHKFEDEDGLIAHSIFYNAIMNFIARAVDNLSLAVTQDDKEKFIEKTKQNICLSIDLIREMKELDKKELQ